RAVEYQKRRLDSETRHSKEPRKRQKNPASRPKKADELNDRKKRASDSKQPRTKYTKPGPTGRESSSPTASRTADRGRDSVVLADSSYTHIDRNILGNDVQVLFQSVLGQLAEQRNVVSAAAASVTSTSPPLLTASSATTNGALKDDAPAENDLHLDSDLDSGKKKPDDTLSGAPLLNGSSNSSLSRSPPSALKRDSDSALPPMVSMNDEDINSPLPVYKALVGKERNQTGLFSRSRIENHRYICEYKGQVVLKAAYKEDPKNYYELLRTTRPYSHFHPEIDICLDARRQGSDARFIRRSCNPNVALRSMYVVGGSSPLIYLGLFANRDVEPDEELTLGWEWEDGELPAVARMSSSDSEEYLSRPEGRRLSKVWRQAFAGVSCACPDLACEVRRLFALLNVDEHSAKPDTGGSMKRRASKLNKAEGGAADNGLQDPPSPQSSGVLSPEDNKSAYGLHSRKGSASVNAENETETRETSADAESNGGGFREKQPLSSDNQLAHNLSFRNSDGHSSHSGDPVQLTINTNGTSGAVNGNGDYEADESSGRQSKATKSRKASGNQYGDSNAEQLTPGDDCDDGSLHSRKRKPSGGQLSVDSIVGTDSESRDTDSNKKHRSSAGVSGGRKLPRSTVLPLKKLWMSKYLEECSDSRVVSKDGENITIAESPSSRPVDTVDVQSPPVVVRKDSKSRSNSPYDDVCVAVDEDLDIAVGASASGEAYADNTEDSGQKIIKSEPTDADAPTPPPTNSPPGLPTPKGESADTFAVADAQTADSAHAPPTMADDSSVQNEAEAGPKELEIATETKVEAASSASQFVAEQTSKPPPKKQRLSLQEYNKRRRVNNPGAGGKEVESKETSAVNTPSATQNEGTAPESVSLSAAPSDPVPDTDGSTAKTRVTLGEYNRRWIPSGSWTPGNADGSASSHSVPPAAAAGALSPVQPGTVPAPVPHMSAHAEASLPSRKSTTPPLPSALLASMGNVMVNADEGPSSQQRYSRSPSLAVGSTALPKVADSHSPARRSLSSSLAPPPLPSQAPAPDVAPGSVSTGAGRGEERPRSSTGYSNGMRAERSGAGGYDACDRDRERGHPGSVYRPREREYGGYRDPAGGAERESGEIAHRRERIRSRSRGHG
ncbi:SET domain-containing protein 3, partial [Coemansia sp. BCRC 34490]